MFRGTKIEANFRIYSEAFRGRKPALCSFCWNRKLLFWITFSKRGSRKFQKYCQKRCLLRYEQIRIYSSADLAMPRNEHFLPRDNGNRSESIPWIFSERISEPYLLLTDSENGLNQNFSPKLVTVHFVKTVDGRHITTMNLLNEGKYVFVCILCVEGLYFMRPIQCLVFWRLSKYWPTPPPPHRPASVYPPPPPAFGGGQ